MFAPDGSTAIASLPDSTYTAKVAAAVAALARPTQTLVVVAEIDLWNPDTRHVSTVRFTNDGFTTRHDDTPADTPIHERLSGEVRLRRSLSRREGGLFGGLIRAEFGEMVLHNEDGALDALFAGRYTDGQEVRIKVGVKEQDAHGREEPEPFGGFALMLRTTAGAMSFDRGEVRLALRDHGVLLQDPIQIRTYAGTGGPEGPEEIAGLTRPVALGRCFNVPLQIVDPARLIYQAHDGQMLTFNAVYDRGAEIPPQGIDFDTYRELENFIPEVGQYVTCLRLGYLKLGTTPQGQVTADLQGDASTEMPFTDGSLFPDGHGLLNPFLDGYTELLAGVVRRILLRFAFQDVRRLELSSFAAFDASRPVTVGLYLPAGQGTVPVERVLDDLAWSCGAIIGPSQFGQYQIRRFGPPSLGAGRTFTAVEFGEDVRARPPAYRVPPWKWQVGFERNHSVQRDADLAGSVTQERRAFLKEPWRLAISNNFGIRDAHSTSREAAPVEGHFVLRDEARAQAARLGALYALGRREYEGTVPNALLSLQLGSTVRLQHPDPGLGLETGRNAIVVETDDDVLSARTRITAFG